MINNKAFLRNQGIITPYVKEKTVFNGVSHGESVAGYDIRIKQDVTLGKVSVGEPVRFSLASTMEEFNIPNNLVAVLHDKSSLIRKGLMIGNTVLEPGWKGFLTLELFYHGSGIIELKAGQGIGQLLFHQIALPAQYDGKYQNQADRPVNSIEE